MNELTHVLSTSTFRSSRIQVQLGKVEFLHEITIHLIRYVSFKIPSFVVIYPQNSQPRYILTYGIVPAEN